MGKLLCNCGQVIIDQSDFIRNKAHIIADQDYFDFFDEIENSKWEELTKRSSKYFNDIFQCCNCNNIIIFKDNKRFDFSPSDKENSSKLLSSYLGQKWLGTISANFRNGQGEIYWNSNLESGFEQNLTFDELKQLYHQKFKELSELKVLRHSFLNIEGNTEHSFENKK
jgi:hypothetical protein